MTNLSQPIARMRRMLRTISRPAGRDIEPGGILIYPYRGYGSSDAIFIMGRVLRQHANPMSTAETLRGELADTMRRLFRRGVPGVRLRIRLNGAVRVVTTDSDGYFRVHMRLARPLLSGPADMWHTLPIERLQNGPAPVAAEGKILVPPDTARLLVISDIDDTVVFTGVANKLKMFIRLFLQGADSRVAFPGTAALYRALHQGITGNEMNPMLYVSRGPWGIYEILEEFFNLHHIPVGPILFLREWGLSWRNLVPRRARGHKTALIRRMLDLYRHLPCILIGDSGQHDPEIYAGIVREYPGRVKAVYIRNVSRSRERYEAIEALAGEIAGQGSSLFLAADSFAMARHMADLGLISKASLIDVLEERIRQQGATGIEKTRRIAGARPTQTRAAVVKGDLKRNLETPAGDGGKPPNIAVESDRE